MPSPHLVAILGMFDEFLARGITNASKPNLRNAPNQAFASSLSNSVKSNKSAIIRNNTNNSSTANQGEPENNANSVSTELTYLSLVRKFGNTSIPHV
jgi:hypothetical protein